MVDATNSIKALSKGKSSALVFCHSGDFQVLFSSLLSELQNKARISIPHPAALKATNFLSFSKTFHTSEIFKHARDLASPSSTSTIRWVAIYKKRKKA
jgi:hypothetical protein